MRSIVISVISVMFITMLSGCGSFFAKQHFTPPYDATIGFDMYMFWIQDLVDDQNPKVASDAQEIYNLLPIGSEEGIYPIRLNKFMELIQYNPALASKILNLLFAFPDKYIAEYGKRFFNYDTFNKFKNESYPYMIDVYPKLPKWRQGINVPKAKPYNYYVPTSMKPYRTPYEGVNGVPECLRETAADIFTDDPALAPYQSPEGTKKALKKKESQKIKTQKVFTSPPSKKEKPKTIRYQKISSTPKPEVQTTTEIVEFVPKAEPVHTTNAHEVPETHKALKVEPVKKYKTNKLDNRTWGRSLKYTSPLTSN